MRAAGLKAIATVVESTAVLISSKHPSDPKLVNLITNRIKGLANASKITPGKRAPTVTSLDDEAWVAVQAMVERKTIASVMDDLSAMGATDIIVTKIDNTR
jgi:ATP phosphoribosyltransferase